MPTSLNPSRPLLCALAVALAWLGQSALAGPRPADGWALLLASLALCIVALSDQSFLVSRRARTQGRQPPSATPVTRAEKWLLGLSLCSTLLALAAFLRDSALGLAWLLHITAILLFVAATQAGALRAAFAVVAGRLRSRPVLLSFGALLLVLCAALAVRIWQVGALPEGLMGDEALYGLVARRILHEPGFVPPAYMEYIQRPPHYAYLVALMFQFFGDSASSLRLVSVCFGLAGIVAAYLLFNRWFGRSSHAGLLAAGLLAVMRYDVTFARIAIDGISTPFLILLSLFFLSRGLDHRQRADFAAAGLILGFSLQFYLPMRLFIALLVVLGLAALLRVLLRRGFSIVHVRAAWRTQVLPFGPPLLCAALGLLSAAAPLGLDALREPSVVFERQYSASIFFEPEEPDLLKRLVNNTLKHLEMFNGLGDRFGRDNLPGAPMLDPLLGMLCVLGLGAVLARPRAFPNMLMLSVFAGMLSAGILSWDKEAPDALRSIGVLPALVYFAVLAQRALFVEARRFVAWLPAWLKVPGAVAWLLLAVIGFGGIAYAELNTYFNAQMRNPEVWAAHDIGATWIGREMARLGSDYDYRIVPVYWGRPTIEYYAPDDRPLLWQDADRISQVVQSDKPVVLFLDYWHRGAIEDARALDPAVPVLELVPPGGGPTYVYEVILSTAMLRRAASSIAATVAEE